MLLSWAMQVINCGTCQVTEINITDVIVKIKSVKRSLSLKYWLTFAA